MKRWGAFAAAICLSLGVGCPTGTSNPEPEPDAPHGPIDFTPFGQDRHAVGGDWYAYNEAAGHVLTPFEQSYVVSQLDPGDGTHQYGAVSLTSYYDPNTAESGVFSFSYSTWDGSGWTAAEDAVTHNIKSEGGYCFDLFTGTERDCIADDDWQFQLRIYRFFVQTGPLVVARPGLFLNQNRDTPATPPLVRAATYETTLALSDLPDPTTLNGIESGPPPDFDDPTFDYARLAPDLPTAGRVLGSRFVADGFAPKDDVYFMADGIGRFVTFQIAPVTAGTPGDGLSVTFIARDLDAGDKTIPTEEVDPETAFVPMPAEGETQYISFARSDLEIDENELGGTDSPNVPPTENTWSMALEWHGGQPSMRLSSAAALYNATFEDNATDLDALPPVE